MSEKHSHATTAELLMVYPWKALKESTTAGMPRLRGRLF